MNKHKSFLFVCIFCEKSSEAIKVYPGSADASAADRCGRQSKMASDLKKKVCVEILNLLNYFNMYSACRETLINTFFSQTHASLCKCMLHVFRYQYKQATCFTKQKGTETNNTKQKQINKTKLWIGRGNYGGIMGVRRNYGAEELWMHGIRGSRRPSESNSGVLGNVGALVDWGT